MTDINQFIMSIFKHIAATGVFATFIYSLAMTFGLAFHATAPDAEGWRDQAIVVLGAIVTGWQGWLLFNSLAHDLADELELRRLKERVRDAFKQEAQD